MGLKANINLDLDQLIDILKSLSENEVEVIESKLGHQSEEILSRLNDVQNKDFRLLTKAEVFNEFNLQFI
jgi:ERCC4-related helicase